jgi:hypothetical protein
MPDRLTPSGTGGDDDRVLAGLGHPRGTLVIVLIYGAVFALGGLGMYLGRFLAHGAPRP